MNAILRLACVTLALAGASQTLGAAQTPGAAAGDPRSFIMIRHVGSINQNMPMVMITTDQTAAESLKGSLWETSRRVHVVSGAKFLRINSFLDTALKKIQREKGAKIVTSDFGTLEFSQWRMDQRPGKYNGTLPLPFSLKLCRELENYLTKESMGPGLIGDFKEIIGRLDGAGK